MSESSFPTKSDLSLEHARVVEAICTSYEKAWQTWQEHWPRIEEYLDQDDRETQAVLLVELVRLECEFRAKLGQPLSPEEYRQRFSEHPWIDQLLDESTPSNDLSITKSESLIRTKTFPSVQPPANVVFSIGGYDVLQELGRGGMGVVYKAHHEQLDRTAAIKMIRAGALADQHELTRFLVEARAIARLKHANIVQIYEIGEHEGQPFFSLEYVEGGTLGEQLKQRRGSPRDSAELVEQLARAMEAAHQHGILHRDLKPGNVLLTPEGEPKITDFGLAKELNKSAEEGLTVSGAVMGTPAYMAPEQARGDVKAFCAATDVYALGVILFEMLTGKLPFRGDSVMDVLRQVEHQEPPSPTVFVGTIHRDLCTICLKCLQKRIDRRYSSAAELADDLRRFLDGEPIHARAVGRTERFWRWCQRNPTVATLSLGISLALMVIVVVGGTAWNIKTVSDANERARGEAERAAVTLRTLAQTQEYHAKLNRVRQRIELGEPGWVKPSLEELREVTQLSTPDRNLPELRTEVVRCLSGMELHGEVLPINLNPRRMATSPDGRYVAIGQERAGGGLLPCMVQLVDVTTKKIVRTLNFSPDLVWSFNTKIGDGVRGLAFSPDGLSLAAVSHSGWVRLWDLSNKGSTPLRSWKPKSDHDGHRSELVFGPDSRFLYSTFVWDGQLFRFDRESSDSEPIQRKFVRPFFGLAVDSKGHHLVIANDRGVFHVDPNDLSTRRMLSERGAWSLACRPDGEVLAVAEKLGPQRVTVHLVDSATGVVVRSLIRPDLGVTALSEIDWMSFSPDGSLLAFRVKEHNAPRIELWETASGRRVAEYFSETGNIKDVGFADGGRALVTLEENRSVLHRIEGATEQTFVAHHVWPVQDFAFSPAGPYLGCLSANGMSVWSWETGLRLDRLPHPVSRGDLSDLNTLTFGPRGKTLLGAVDANTFLAWHPMSNDPPVVHEAQGVCDLGLTPDGDRLWVARGGEVFSRVLSWPENKELGTWTRPTIELAGGPREVLALAIGSTRVLAGGVGVLPLGARSGQGYVFEGGSFQPSRTFDVPGGKVFAVALSPDETLGALGTNEGKVRLVSLPTGKPVLNLADHRSAVRSMDFSSDGTLFATASDDRSVRLYLRHGQTYRPFFTLRPVTAGPIEKIEFDPTDRVLGILCQNETAVRLWHLDRVHDRLAQMGLGDKDWRKPASAPQKMPRITTYEEALLQAQRSRQRGEFERYELLLSRAIQLANDREQSEPRLKKELGSKNLDLSPCHQLTVEGRIENLVVRPGTSEVLALGDRAYWFDAASGQLLDKPAPAHDRKYMLGAGFSADGKLLVTGGRDGYARLCDATTGQPIRKFLHAEGVLLRMTVLSPDGQWLVIGGDDQKWSVRSVSGDRVVFDRYYGKGDAVQFAYSGAFSADGKYFLTAGKTGDLFVHRAVGDYPVLVQSERQDSGILQVRLHPDGSRMAMLSRHGKVSLWDMPSGRLRRRMQLPTSIGWGNISFHPKGTALAVTCKKSMWLVDPDMDEILHTFPQATGERWGVAYHSDGKTIVTGSNDGKLTVWEVDLSRLAPEAIRLDIEIRHGKTWTEDGTLRTLTFQELQAKKQQ